MKNKLPKSQELLLLPPGGKNEEERHVPRRIIHSRYLEELFDYDKYKRIVDEVCWVALKKFPKADGVLFRGASGCMVGLAVAHALKMSGVMVRKENEDCHSPLKLEGRECQNYFIVDDIVSSGRTVRAIVEAAQARTQERERGWALVKGRCLGVVAYLGEIDKWVDTTEGSVPVYSARRK